jgi:hemoglobin
MNQAGNVSVSPTAGEGAPFDPGINEAMIEGLVRAFYGRARLDPLLGPVFEAAVTDWEAHIGRLCAFWSSITLKSGRYRGEPMAAHVPLPIDSPHFERWLELFADTVEKMCLPAAAAVFMGRANQIADSLELGMAAKRGEIKSAVDRPIRAERARA